MTSKLELNYGDHSYGECVALVNDRYSALCIQFGVVTFLKCYSTSAVSFPFIPNGNILELRLKSRLTSKVVLFGDFLMWTKEYDKLSSFCCGLGLHVIPSFQHKFTY